MSAAKQRTFQKLKSMDTLKAEGNAAVKRLDFPSAVRLYKDALAAMRPGEEEEMAAVYSNLSFAHLKLGSLQEALEAADSCVRAKPTWQKGYFRKGEVLFALQQYDDATVAYQKASELAPDDATIKKRVAQTNEALQGFFFRQLSPGRHFAVGKGSSFIQAQINTYAQEMKNFVYLVGDAGSREVVLVDPAWDAQGILDYAESELVKVVGIVATHHHFDHVGGKPPAPFDALGIRLSGVKEVAAATKAKVFINKHDVGTVAKSTGISLDYIQPIEDKHEMSVGRVKLAFLHTPGHTPGSQCIIVTRPSSAPGQEKMLLSGDTLFIGSCGRLDLPGCDLQAMYHSLQDTLASLPDSTRVYPGHNYGGSFTTIAAEKNTGMLAKMTEERWQKLHHRM